MDYHEQYRPKVRFFLKERWVKDLKGMLYDKDIYHLFSSFIRMVQSGG